MTKVTEISRELKSLVRKEANNLRKYATPEELDKLDIRTLDPNIAYTCIYGQMTGTCHTNRALQLIKKCNTKKVGGRNKYIRFNNRTNKYIYGYYSPIELFTMLDKKDEKPGTNTKRLVRFLKGNSNNLTFV